MKRLSFGTYTTPAGLTLRGFHVFDSKGVWYGVYQTETRAAAHLRRVT
jgi:hypothetical protein